MTSITLEEKLTFTFDSSWRALKWDDERAYREGIGRLTGTKAVDIVATRLDSEFWLFEGKDPRGHRAEFKKQHLELHHAVAAKVRDTIAGLAWSVGRLAPPSVESMLKALLGGRGSKVFIVVWLEGVEPGPADALQVQIRSQLRWLNPKVIVTSRKLLAPSPRRIEGLEVTSLPGAPPRG